MPFGLRLIRCISCDCEINLLAIAPYLDVPLVCEELLTSTSVYHLMRQTWYIMFIVECSFP